LNKAVEEKTEKLKIKNKTILFKEPKSRTIATLVSPTQAYKLFSDRKTSLEVAIALNLRESEATKFILQEYWKLKQLYNLNIVFMKSSKVILPYFQNYIGCLTSNVWV
jgi:hypothetical protein